MAEINDLNVTDASNTARFPENQAPGTVNDGARALEGLLARWHKDTNGSVSSTGSANAYAVAANQTISAYYDGLIIVFDANFANTGSATLNVDGVGASTIQLLGSNLASGAIAIGQKVAVIYDGTNWQMISPSLVQTITTLTLDTVNVDTVNEKTAANGVAIDGVTLKDSGITVPNNAIVQSQAYSPRQTLTYGATTNWDLNSGAKALLSLTGNTTMAAPTNMQDGATYVLWVFQDATGSRTITWNSVFKWENGVAPSLSTGANDFDIFTFECNGTGMMGTGAFNFS